MRPFGAGNNTREQQEHTFECGTLGPRLKTARTDVRRIRYPGLTDPTLTKPEGMRLMPYLTCALTARAPIILASVAAVSL